jgi:hypothetical protein
MFDRLPMQFWLLILIGVFAYPAVTYVYRHVVRSPSQRDMVHSAEDLTRRSSVRLNFSLIWIVLLVVLAIFIFTPAAAEVAQSPNFLPLLMAALSAFCIYEIVQGFIKGEVMPLTRGGLGPYRRIDQPRRYWASMIWNVMFACLMVFLIFKA